MELKHQSVVALVGKNGSGKTTISLLLAGLLHAPNSSNIMLLPDGSNFFAADATMKKQLVQMVPQGALLLNLSFYNSVVYGNPRAIIEQVEAVLESASCTGFISKFPDGIHFKVGVNGCHLSGGQ